MALRLVRPVRPLAAVAGILACTGDADPANLDDAGARGAGTGGRGAGGASAEPPPCETDLEPQLARLGVPGLSAALVKHGRVVCTAVAGLANVEEDRPVTPDTTFWWASVSKPVAATAALAVFEEGGFALEDEVNATIPFRVAHPDGACAGKPITFYALLTHTSSIREDDYLLPDGAYYSPTANFTAACPGSWRWATAEPAASRRSATTSTRTTPTGRCARPSSSCRASS